MPPRRKGTLDLNTPVSAQTLADLVGLNRVQIFNLVRDGTLPPLEDSVMPLAKAVQAYVQHCRGERKKHSQTTQRAGLLEEQTRKLRLDNDVKEGTLCDTENVFDLTKVFVGTVQSELANWSARVSKDPTMRAAVEKEVVQSLERIKTAVMKATEEIFADDPVEDAEEETDEEPLED